MYIKSLLLTRGLCETTEGLFPQHWNNGLLEEYTGEEERRGGERKMYYKGKMEL